MTIAVEERRLRSLFERVEAVEDVARTLAEDDERRAKLLAVSDSALAEEGTVRPVIAARLLGLSEKTVRAWAAALLRALCVERAAIATTRCPLSDSTAVRRSVTEQPPLAWLEHEIGTISFPPLNAALPMAVSPADTGAPPTGIVTNALFAVALPPPSVAVTSHWR